MKILIKNTNHPTLNDIAIADGKIYKLGKITDFSADKIINASGLTAIPGIVDLSCKLYDNGEINSIIYETKAAVAAGVTTICLPPDTSPSISSPAVIELIEQRQAQANLAKILPMGTIFENNTLSNMATLAQEGCVGFSNIGNQSNSLNVLKRAMEYASTFDLTLHLFGFNYDLAQDGTVHASGIGAALGLAGLSYVVETVAIAEILLLAKETEVKVHLCRLSSKSAVEMVAKAKAEGLNITSDVGINQLFFTDQNLQNQNFNSNFRVIPPFRTEADKQALRKGVLDGTIDAICSDHQPQSLDSKLKPFSEASIGTSSLDSLIHLVLKFSTETNTNIVDLVPKISTNPAKIVGQNVGEIAVGKIADIALIDVDHSWKLTKENMFSLGFNTPLLNQRLKGQNMLSIVGGNIVFSRKDEL